jgi:hypothetical protein
MCLFFCLLVSLLAVIADKHQDAGQIVRVQISVSLAGGRSAYQHRYAELNAVSCILSAWLPSSNRGNTIGSLTNDIYGISLLNIKL